VALLYVDLSAAHYYPHIDSIAERNGSSTYAVGIFNQITFLILYYMCSRLATLLKVTDALNKFPIFFILLLISRS